MIQVIGSPKRKNKEKEKKKGGKSHCEDGPTLFDLSPQFPATSHLRSKVRSINFLYFDLFGSGDNFEAGTFFWGITRANRHPGTKHVVNALSKGLEGRSAVCPTVHDQKSFSIYLQLSSL